MAPNFNELVDEFIEYLTEEEDSLFSEELSAESIEAIKDYLKWLLKKHYLGGV